MSCRTKLNGVIRYLFYVCSLCIGINCVFFAYPGTRISYYTEIDANKTSVKQEETLEQRLLGILLRNFSKYQPPCPWPPKRLNGRQALNRTRPSFEKLKQFHSFMEYGHYKPSCKPYQKIAIIVPYRDREDQLKVFLNNVIPRVYNQRQEFGIYLVEQADRNPFNRGMLSNIGYVHAMQEYQYDCVVIHDVDILPENDKNLYFCDDQHPFHLAGKVEKFNYSIPYPDYFGGISSLTRHQYKALNGFSNLFFGWGAEDDDFLRRLRNAGYEYKRPFEEYSHCGSIAHKAAPHSKHRLTILRKVKRLWKKEGLNTLDYRLIKKEKKQLFVWIYASLSMDVLSKAGVHIPLDKRKRKFFEAYL